ncbi:MAG: TlpA family protein disulfide reductase, partial [Owenweeksia sp.]
NAHVANFEDRVTKLKEAVAVEAEMNRVRESLAPGKPVPNIAMTGPDGTTHNLADLRGKVVLVDFWAGWCRPCRAENPNLVRMYNEYKGKGFEVFSVSLDGLPQQPNPKEDWTKAIEDDGLLWKNHVSDLQGWNSSVVRQFGFMSIPYTILVDREGNIIATELRGPQLEAKLKEVLGA